MLELFFFPCRIVPNLVRFTSAFRVIGTINLNVCVSIPDRACERLLDTGADVGLGHHVVRGRSLANVSCLCLPGQCEQFVQISCHWFLKTRSGPGLWGRVASLLHKPDRLLAINRATHLLPTLMIFELLKSTLFGTINRYFNTFIVFV